MTGLEHVDVAVVGAGPAGATAALGALRADPRLRVLLLDRADFPRDKPCGDGIAPHVLDVLEEVGVTGLLDDRVEVRRLRLARGPLVADREMTRPAYVVPRTVFDHRLVEAAQAAGAELQRHRVRTVEPDGGGVVVDGRYRASVVVGADGAHSVLRRGLDGRSGQMAVALRGYAPTPPGRAHAQVIAFGTARQPAYAWSFDRGDGWCNVGYGELVGADRPTRAALLERLDELLPGATDGGEQWQGHQLPLSGWRGAVPGRGRVLLAGDAARLVNPMTGEGIYYAVATGVLAGRAAAVAIAAGDPEGAAARHRRSTRRLLGSHLRHTAVAARICRSGRALDAGLRATAADQEVFDDLVELGLGRGRLTPTILTWMTRSLAGHVAHRATATARVPVRSGAPSGRDVPAPTEED